MGNPRRPRHTRAGEAVGNSRRARHTLCCSLVVLLLTGVCIAGPPLASIDLGNGGTTVEIVRCHFKEGRIVLRIDGELHVLRKGDRIELDGLQLLEISKYGATITTRRTPPDDGLRLIRITDSGSGTLSLREFTTDPGALSPSPREAPAAPIARVEPSQRGTGQD